jgi:hypothetical protein
VRCDHLILASSVVISSCEVGHGQNREPKRSLPRVAHRPDSGIRLGAALRTRHPAWHDCPAICQPQLGAAESNAEFAYFVIIPVMAVARSLVVKKRVPPSAGTFPTHGPLFVFAA